MLFSHLVSLAILAGANTPLVSSASVYYHLDLSWGKGSPDGAERDMVFINQEFPGPPLIADEGDEVTVCWLQSMN